MRPGRALVLLGLLSLSRAGLGFDVAAAASVPAESWARAFVKVNSVELGVAERLDDLTLVRASPDAGLAKPLRVFGATPASGSFQNLVSFMVQDKVPGRFAAIAADSDLAPLLTLPSIRWEDSSVLLTGAIEGPEAAAGRGHP